MKEKSSWRNNGFTLVELMVVIGLLAFLALCAGTFIDTNSWFAHYRLRTVATGLGSDLQYAKMEAVKRNVNCALTFNKVDGAITYYYIVYVDTNANCICDTGETILKRMNLAGYPGITSNAITFPNNADTTPLPSIAFDPRGIPRDSTGSFITTGQDSATLQDSQGNRKSVVVSPAGRITVQ
jgi:prepilin-type N-terminal cleavage/methylation domain-containing protein